VAEQPPLWRAISPASGLQSRSTQRSPSTRSALRSSSSTSNRTQSKRGRRNL